MPRKKSEKSARTAASRPGLPTPEQILEFIADNGSKTGKREIARAFGIKGADRIPLKKMLKDMADQGLIAGRKNRLNKAGTLPPVAVLIVDHIDNDGEMIAVPQNWDEEAEGQKPLVILTNDSTRRRMPKPVPPKVGDRVLARIREAGLGDYLYEASIMRRLQDESRDLLGVIRKTPKGMRLVPVDKKAKSELEITAGAQKDAKSGELVRAEIIHDRGRGLVSARVLERLGDLRSEKNISQISIQQYGIPNTFSGKVLDETERLERFSEKGRTDLRDMPLITIDPADARDHDDAVYAEPDDEPENPGGFKVTVAIADVAAYVRSGTALDEEARERGNSVYFPDLVVPMLPERISNDLCSLRENEDRPALACHLIFDAKGRKRTHRFDRIIMRSAAKLAYEQAQAAIDGKADDKTGPLLDPVLKPLWAAYRAVTKARNQRAPLELEVPERRLILNEDGAVKDVVTPERLDAHRLVEEFMIQANVAAAETLEKARSPLIYRVHEAPSEEKMAALAEFLKSIGLSTPKGQVMKPMHFNAILEKARGADYERVLNEVILRTQSQAVYSPDNRGHFGLNLRRYAHFTSPIRRYADLIVHRALITALKLGKDGLYPSDLDRLEETADLISSTERRAMAAERDTKDRLIASYLSKQLRARFFGRIAGVVGAGLFVTLDETGADGFIPASTIGSDYYRHNETVHALIGDRTGETFQLGDRVEVRLVEAAPVSGGLRFELLSDGKKGKPMPRHQRNRRTGPRRRR